MLKRISLILGIIVSVLAILTYFQLKPNGSGSPSVFVSGSDSGSITPYPDTIVRTSWVSVLLLFCILSACGVAGIVIIWNIFDKPFAWEHLEYFGLAIMLLAAGAAGLPAEVKQLRCRRVVLILTSTRLQFPNGSWISWANIENIVGLPTMCGIRLASYRPYVDTVTSRQKTYARLSWRALLAMLSVNATSKLSGLTFSGADVFPKDAQAIGDFIQDVSEAAETVEEAEGPDGVTRGLKYTRSRFGFDMFWGQFPLDWSPSDLARLMIEYQEHEAVERFLKWEHDPARRGIADAGAGRERQNSCNCSICENPEAPRRPLMRIDCVFCAYTYAPSGEPPERLEPSVARMGHY